MSNGRRSKCGHFLLGLAVKQSSKAGGQAGAHRIWDLWILWMYLVEPTRTLETPVGCDKTRYDTDTHWPENGSMGWAGFLLGWLFC